MLGCNNVVDVCKSSRSGCFVEAKKKKEKSINQSK